MEIRLCLLRATEDMITKQDHLVIAGLGIQFAVIMCMGTFGGYYLDKKIGSLPFLTLGGSALAFALAIYIVIRSAKTYVNKEKTK